MIQVEADEANGAYHLFGKLFFAPASCFRCSLRAMQFVGDVVCRWLCLVVFLLVTWRSRLLGGCCLLCLCGSIRCRRALQQR